VENVIFLASINGLDVTFIVLLCATVVACIIFGLIALGNSHALRKINGAIKNISGGKFDEAVFTRKGGETGRLAHNINDMSAALKSIFDGLSAERARLLTVLSTMTDAVIVTDAAGNTILTNNAAEKLFDFKDSQAIGRPTIEIIRDHEIDDLVKKCLKSGLMQTTQLEFGLARKFLRIIVSPIERDKIVGCLMISQDLTELRNIQTMRRELVGNISHDLRTPIAGIKAMTETLIDGAVEDRPTALNFLRRIDAEIDRLSHMVSELTELSRIETGKTELNKIPVDINTLVEDILKQMVPLAERRNVNIKTNLKSGLPRVPADNERVRQTIVNLIDNAIKFNHEHGSILITTLNDADSVTVSVADNGTGISRDDLPHVFERFYKSDKSRGGGGSGLGLAIAKHTVQAHGGRIWAESEEGKGSTFNFTLPLNSSAAVPQ